MRHSRQHEFAMVVFALVAAAPVVAGRAEAADAPRPLAGPVEDGPFLRPAAANPAEPFWGIKGGIGVGIWPTGGPRGQGRTATQYWRAPAGRNLVARVNARKTYWASQAAVPGGVAFENFELEAPFHPGQKFVFGITPDLPAALGFHHR
jgi:hypothetical protein